MDGFKVGSNITGNIKRFYNEYIIFTLIIRKKLYQEISNTVDAYGIPRSFLSSCNDTLNKS